MMANKNHFFLLICSIFLLQQCLAVQKSPARLLIVTVATDEHNDGLQRLRNSAETFGHKLQVFGTNERWNGGEMRAGMGGAQKVRILRENLSAYKNQDDLIVMFVDAYDVILNANAMTILKRFAENFNGQKILFGAEPFCWPDRTLAPEYPLISFGERFLNSGMFMGYAPKVVEMLELGVDLKDGDDDQLFYTKLFLNEEKRQSLGITLDSLSWIFQNLNGLTEHVQIDYDSVDGYAKVFNKLYNTHPVVIHGNGPSKLILNSIGNYIAHRVHNKRGCEYCEKDGTVNTVVDSPLFVMGLFVARSIPYVEEFLDYIRYLNYPKEKVHLFVFNNQEYNKKTVASFIEDVSNSYASIKSVNMDSDSELLTDEYAARNFILKLAHDLNADYALIVDADSHLTDRDALMNLLRVATAGEIGILTPMMVKPGLLFSNFWGALSESGFYARSPDYVPIVERQRVGTWNVPFINSVWLISRRKIGEFGSATPFSYNRQLDVDMSFAAFCRDNGHFMFVDSQGEYGYLVDTNHFANLPDQYIHREIYDYPNNRLLWERRYIHADYFDLLEPDVEVPLACPDVYDFPFLSERFCTEIIAVMEQFGRWSDGSNHDRRLEGGYENVPTRDIHMNQVGLEQQWLAVLDAYVAPIQEKIFIGYYQRPVKANMMFVVRYRPDEQPSLRPHHDASTYSIDVALNKRGADYEGGGVHYVRYNCTVPADQIGWSMIFPGRLTHLHEGLPTTKGTRYILVSFINP